MPEMTPHISLKKPLVTETADISVINENMDTIDSALGDLAAVPTTAKTAAGAIAELHEALQDIDVDIPDGSITPAKLSFDPATQTELDAHANGTNVHGATNAPTASRLIIRDAAGRAKVASPAASDDIARLDSITKAQAGLGNVDNFGTATQAEAEAGTTTNKFMTPQRTKQYVDRRLMNNIIWRINNGQPEWSNDGGGTWSGMGMRTMVASNNVREQYLPVVQSRLANSNARLLIYKFAPLGSGEFVFSVELMNPIVGAHTMLWAGVPAFNRLISSSAANYSSVYPLSQFLSNHPDFRAPIGTVLSDVDSNRSVGIGAASGGGTYSVVTGSLLAFDAVPIYFLVGVNHDSTAYARNFKISYDLI